MTEDNLKTENNLEEDVVEDSTEQKRLKEAEAGAEAEEAETGAGAEAGAADNPKKKPKKKRRRLLLVIILALIALLMLAVGAGGWIWHEQPSFCGTVCHDTMQSYVDTWEDSNYLVRAHAENEVTCLQCHEATTSQQIQELTTQLRGDYVLPLAKMQIDDEFCMGAGCHARDDLDTAVFITDTNGTRINPHTHTMNNDPHSPHAVGGETISCSSCHTMHRRSIEIDYCYGCHHTQTFESCYSCH